MAHKEKKRRKPAYTREKVTDDSRRWHEIGDAPDSPLWKSREEYEYIKAKREAAKRKGMRDDGEWDSIELHDGIPRSFPFVYEEPRFVLIITEDARDQLKANGHLHAATATHNGYQFYFFAHGWDLNDDLANYFDEGIDYQERSIM